MFKSKKESTFEKRQQQAVDQWGEFVVSEVVHAVELVGIHDCLIMFTEWEMDTHVNILKTMYL
jgi:hypothetical protein